jgi:hypothetical protein
MLKQGGSTQSPGFSQARLADASTQQRLVARAVDIGKRWPELPVARKRAVLIALIERIEVRVDQIDIHLRPPRLDALLDVTVAPSQGATDDEIQPTRVTSSCFQLLIIVG